MTSQPLTAAQIKQDRLQKKKETRKYLMIGAGVLVFCYLVYLMFVPHKGPDTFGVCKTFLELQVPYPDHLRYSSFEDMGAQVRIWFTQVDSFGEYRLEAMTCTYRGMSDADKKKYGDMPFALDKASINRRDIDKAAVEEFNYTIPSIIASGPDLTLPSPLPDSLRDLQGTNSMRKPIF